MDDEVEMDEEQQLLSKISGERIKSVAERLSRTSMRITGSENERITCEAIADEFRKLDLDVSVEEFDTTSWEHGAAQLITSNGAEKRIDVHFMPFSPSVPEKGSKGIIVPLKFGFPKELASIGNEACIVIVDWNQDAGVHYQILSAAKSGKKIAALGLISQTKKSFRVDAIPMLAKPIPFPVFSITYEDGLMLRTTCSKDRVMGRLEGRSKIIKGAKSANVVAHKKGSIEPDLRVVVSAHHDGWFAGANDNLSGIGCILETASILCSEETRRSLDFISFGSEESGSTGFQYYLWGSRNYVKRHAKDIGKVSCVLNNEIAGHSNTEHLLVDCTPDLVPFFEVIFDELSKRPFAVKNKVEMSAAVPTSSQADQLNFSLSGVPSSLIYWAWYDEYHTDIDTADLLSVDRLRLFEELSLVSAIRAVNSQVLPLSLTRYARILRTGHSVVSSHLSKELGRVATPGLEHLKRLTGERLELGAAMDALDSFSKASGAFERYLSTAEECESSKDNLRLLATCFSLNKALCRTGGVLGEDAMFPGFLQYTEELRKIDEAVEIMKRVKGSDMSPDIKRELIPIVVPEVETREFDISDELNLLVEKREKLRDSLQKEVDRIAGALREAEICLKR
jgi:Iap family predicted aminopeptidase